jgi:hypothetical protein
VLEELPLEGRIKNADASALYLVGGTQWAEAEQLLSEVKARTGT